MLLSWMGLLCPECQELLKPVREDCCLFSLPMLTLQHRLTRTSWVHPETGASCSSWHFQMTSFCLMYLPCLQSTFSGKNRTSQYTGVTVFWSCLNIYLVSPLGLSHALWSDCLMTQAMRYLYQLSKITGTEPGTFCTHNICFTDDLWPKLRLLLDCRISSPILHGKCDYGGSQKMQIWIWDKLYMWSLLPTHILKKKPW